MAETETGTVKFYSEKGYGFIQRSEEDKGDIFFHCSQLLNANSLEKDDKVEFEVGENERSGKTCALKVKLIQE